MTRYNEYGSEYPYVSWRRQYRRMINTIIISVATIIVFMAVLCLSIVMLPGAIDKEVSRQVAQVEKSLGVKP